MRQRLRYFLTCALLVTAAPAGAQTLAPPGPPGPFVIDIRGVMSGIPRGGDAYLAELPVDALVPGRGFGGSIGGHVYILQLGPARLGLGADVAIARGSTADASTTLTTVAPQVSMNFGTSDGWSYLSAGIGNGRIALDRGSMTDTVQAINFGGGARWFLRPHVGIGFDVRIHRLDASDVTPRTTAVAVGVGLSVK